MTEAFAHLLPAVVLEMLFIVAASTLPSVQVFVIHDHRLWWWLRCWRSADSHKLAHKFYCHLCPNTFQIEFFCSRSGSWNASEHLIIIFSAKNDRPGAPYNIGFNTLLCSSTSSLCSMSFECVRLTCFQLLIHSCVVPTPRTLPYSTVLLLSPSLCMHPHRYAVTHAIWQMSAKTIVCTWTDTPPISGCTHKHTIASLECIPHPRHTYLQGEQLEIKQTCRESVLVWHIWVKRHGGVLTDMGWVRACSCCALSRWGFFHMPAFHRLLDAPACC